jgi:hypothetical protein
MKVTMFNELLGKLEKLDLKLSRGYEGHQEATRSLILEAEKYLIAEYGVVASWETKELEAAKYFTDSNWLKAATQAIAIALVVSEYDDEEYWGGFIHSNKDAQRTPRRI